ncbi:MAG: hypothetical protein HYY18_21145 [Planctomycetes bacterium]|nr:hypothetical protein [Planctomycetota bacterium]
MRLATLSRISLLAVAALIAGRPVFAQSDPGPESPAVRRDARGCVLPRFAVARCGSSALRHAHSVGDVAFTPDGRFLVSVAGDSSVRVWNAVDGTPIAVGEAPSLWGNLQISWDGTKIAVTDKGVIRLMTLPALERIRDILAGEEGAELAAFSPGDDRVVSTGGEAGAVTVWEVATGRRLLSFGAEKEVRTTALAWSPTGGLIAMAREGERGNPLETWNPVTGEKIGSFSLGELDASLVFRADGRAVFASNGHGIMTLDLETGKVVRPTDAGSGDGFVLLRSGDEAVVWDRALVSVTSLADQENPRDIWEAPWSWRKRDLRRPDRDRMLREMGRDRRILSVAVSPDGARAAVATTEMVIRLVDLKSGKELPEVVGPANGGGAGLSISPDGTRVATGSYHEGLFVWDLETGKLIRHVNEEDAPASRVAWSPDGRFIATLGHGALTIRNATTGSRFARFECAKPESNPVWRQGSGRIMLFEDKSLIEWNLSTERLRRVAQIGNYGYTEIGVSPDGSRIVTGPRDCEVLVMDAESGEVQARVASHRNTHAVSFSPSGYHIASAGSDRKVHVRRASDAQVLVSYGPFPEEIEGLAWSADGRLLAAALWRSLIGNPTGDMSIRILEIASGDEIAVLRNHSGRARELEFTADGRRLVTSMEDGTALVWDMEEACGMTAPVGDEDAAWEKLWAALAGRDPVPAWKALGALSAKGAESLAESERRLLEAAAPCPEAEAAIRDLDDEDPGKRDQAFGRLTRMDAETEVRDALGSDPTAELKARLSSILALAEERPGAASPRQRLALRTIAVVERIGGSAAAAESSESLRILRAAAEHSPWERVRREARAAVARLSAHARPK